MIEYIHGIIYDWRWLSYLVALLGIAWSMRILFVHFAIPKSEPMSRRQAHKIQAQQHKVKTATINENTGAARNPEEGSQANLLDSLKEDAELGQAQSRDVRDSNASEFQKAPTVSAIDGAVLEKIIGDVTNKVASQIEDLTGQPFVNELSEEEQQASTIHMNSADIQDMLETIQEDSDSHAIIPQEGDHDAPEGDHTAAIRKASRMEEIGLHNTRPAVETERNAPSAFEEAAAALLGDNALDSKHYDRLGELGLVEDREGTISGEDNRLRTAQIDDILGRLDDVLDIGEDSLTVEDSTTVEDSDHVVTEIISAENRDSSQGVSSDIAAALDVKTETEIKAVDTEDPSQTDTEPEVGIEGTEEDRTAPFNLAETVHMEVDTGSELYDNPVHTSTHAKGEDEDEADDFFSSMGDNEEETITTDINSEKPLLSKKEELAETVSVARDISDDDQAIDPNLETTEEDTSTEDDLPAWARADTFDEDLKNAETEDENGDEPTQQKLF